MTYHNHNCTMTYHNSWQMPLLSWSIDTSQSKSTGSKHKSTTHWQTIGTQDAHLCNALGSGIIIRMLHNTNTRLTNKKHKRKNKYMIRELTHSINAIFVVQNVQSVMYKQINLFITYSIKTKTIQQWHPFCDHLTFIGNNYNKITQPLPLLTHILSRDRPDGLVFHMHELIALNSTEHVCIRCSKKLLPS